MEIYTNAHQELKLGHAGFDVVEISGFEDAIETKTIEKYDPNTGEIVKRTIIGRAFDCTLDELKTINRIYSQSDRKFIIREPVEKPLFEFSFGLNGMNKFAILKVYTTDISNANLANMTIGELRSKIKEYCAYLQSNYQLNVNYNPDKLHIKSAEINKTFPVCRPYSEYYRILTLMSYALQSQKRHHGDKMVHADVNTWDPHAQEKNATKYLIVGKTQSVKAYNKSTEMKKKDGLRCTFDAELMRIEITADEQNLASIADSSKECNSVCLKDITDDKIEAYYNNYFNKVFNFIDKYLAEQLEFPEPTVTSGSVNFTGIINMAIQHLIRLEPETLVDNILQLFWNAETATGLPLLLEVSDLSAAINKSLLAPNIKETITEQLELMYREPTHFSDICRHFLGAKTVLNELRQNLCTTRIHQLCILAAEDTSPSSTDYIWLSSPLYTQPYHGMPTTHFNALGHTCQISEKEQEHFEGIYFTTPIYVYLFDSEEQTNDPIIENREEADALASSDLAMSASQSKEDLALTYDMICMRILRDFPDATIGEDKETYITSRLK